MATVGYITEEDAIAHVHKIALDKGAPFDAEDQDVVKKACAHAYRRIRAILMERGVAEADVARWEDGASAQMSLTAHYALKDLFVARGREIPPWLLAFNVEDEIRQDTIVATNGDILAKGAAARTPGRIFGVDLEKQMNDNEHVSEGDYDD
jgi:hypothetical protein